MAKCIICEKRPAKKQGFCAHCGNQLAAQRKAKASDTPRYFLTYRGHVVALVPTGNRTLKPRLLKRRAQGLPKYKTINLDAYCVGFSREIIKRFKACVLQVARA